MARKRRTAQAPPDMPFDSDPGGPIDVYANSAHVVMSAFECLIEFSTTTPVGDLETGKQPTAFERAAVCRVRMSPQHAKSIAAILLKHIKSYESQFAKLALPQDMQQMWDEATK